VILTFIAPLSYTSIAHALTITCTAPALTALVAWRLLGEPMPPRGWGGIARAAVAHLAAVPLAAGHTLYTTALRRMHPATVNIVASLEVLGGILLAWLVLGEVRGGLTP